MAAPNPEKEIARLESALAGKEPPRAIALQGPAAWFRDRALDIVRATLGAGGEVSELDGAESGGSESEAGRFLVDLRTSSLFGARKMLLLRNAEAWLRLHAQPLADTLGRVAAGNILVLAVAKLDGRSALARRIKKTGGIFEFRNLYDKPFGAGRPAVSAEIVGWVVRRAALHGITLDPPAALFMTEVAGADPGVLDGELRRIRPLVSDRRVTADDLRGMLTVSFGSTQFELVDAILEGDPKTALRSVAAMFREGLRDRNGKPIESSATFPIVASWLLQSVGKLLEGRAALDAGASLPSVLAEHGGYFKERFARQLDRRSRADLVAILGALRRAERRLRATGEEGRVLLERLVCEVLLPIRADLLGHGSRAW